MSHWWCCCGCDCIVDGDRFNRADTGGWGPFPGYEVPEPGELGAKWEQVLGTWYIESSGWPSPSLGGAAVPDARAICKFTGTYPEAVDEPIAYRVFAYAGNLSYFRLLVDYTDEDNYLAAEVRTSELYCSPSVECTAGVGTKLS